MDVNLKIKAKGVDDANARKILNSEYDETNTTKKILMIAGI